MNIEKIKSIIEAILFSAGRIVQLNELILVLEQNEDDIVKIIKQMQDEYDEKLKNAILNMQNQTQKQIKTEYEKPKAATVYTYEPVMEKYDNNIYKSVGSTKVKRAAKGIDTEKYLNNDIINFFED